MRITDLTLLRRIARRLLLLVACMFAFAANASAADIWVVTDRLHPVKVIPGVRLIQLDAPAHLEKELAAQLPSDPEQAAAIARQRLKDGGVALQKHLVTAYQGVIDAWSLGITKIPAIVVDRRYVVYGEPDVAHALALIDKHRSSLP